MSFWIASDHAGVDVKAKVVEWLKQYGLRDIRDLGPASTESVHYPDFAGELCRQVLSEQSEEKLLQPSAILICGSGVGMSIAANRFRGIRAVLAHRPDVAQLSRAHNASNVLCLGARINSWNEIESILKAWFEAKFEGGRHQGRIAMLEELE